MPTVFESSLPWFSTALLLAGCSTVDSTPLPVQNDTTGGISSVSGATRAGGYYLPKSLLSLTLRKNNDSTTPRDAYYFDEPILKRIPDPDKFYRLDLHLSINADDDFKVEWDGATGFLKKLTLSSDEKSAQIIETVAKTVITLISGVPSAKLGTSPQARAAREQDPIVFQQIVDPTNPAAVGELNIQLVPFQRCIWLQPEPVFTPPTSNGNAKAGGTAGLFYRIPRPYRMTTYYGHYSGNSAGIQGQNSTDAHTAQNRDASTCAGDVVSAYILAIENTSPVMRIDVTRAAFVKSVNTVDFTDGMVTALHVEKPSSSMAIVRVPLDIADAIVSLPAQILQLRIDQTNQRQQLIDAQDKVVTAQKSLIEAEAQLAEARRKVAETGGTTSPAPSPDESPAR
jgi:hypothetical protein